MALPQDGQNANGLTKVTEIPKGKELIFIDPTTNEGGIITLEDLTTQILKKLTSQTFALDQGNMTLLAALNQLNSNRQKLCSDANITDLNAAITKDKIITGIAYGSATNYIPDKSGFSNVVYIPCYEKYGIQLVFSSTSNLYVRSQNGNAWSAWLKLN